VKNWLRNEGTLSLIYLFIYLVWGGVFVSVFVFVNIQPK